MIWSQPTPCTTQSLPKWSKTPLSTCIHPRYPPVNRRLRRSRMPRSLPLTRRAATLRCWRKRLTLRRSLAQRWPQTGRRGLAYDLVGVLSYNKVHESWLQRAYARLQDPPIPGYMPTSLQQIIRADRALWLHLAQKTIKLTRAAPNEALSTPRCLDADFQAAMNNAEVNFHLLPLPRSGNSRSSVSLEKEATRQGQGHMVHEDRSLNQWTSSAQGQQPPMPFRLRGGVAAMPQQKKLLCFGANLDECKDAALGGKCACFQESAVDSFPHTAANSPPLQDTEPRAPDLVPPNEDGADNNFPTSPICSDRQVLNESTEKTSCPTPVQDFWVLELFAGTAGITAALVSAGLSRSFGIDSTQKTNHKAKVLQLDLRNTTCQQTVLRWSHSPGRRLDAHMGPAGLATCDVSQLPVRLLRQGVDNSLWPWRTVCHGES